jgi:hypothetical protein
MVKPSETKANQNGANGKHCHLNPGILFTAFFVFSLCAR